MTRESYTYMQWHIPTHMLEALDRYVNHGIEPGGFLTAVLCNDFAEACGRADQDNIKNLPAYASYLYNELPIGSWGSSEQVGLWMARICRLRTEVENASSETLPAA